MYSCFVLLPEPQPATLLQYDVSAAGLRIIYATLILLLAAIWYGGFYGYAKLRAYAQLVGTGKDGKHVLKLTQGVFLIVMWLPVTAVVSAILGFIALRHAGLLPAVTIIDNYLNLLLPLLGFSFIGLGARGLSELVRRRPTYAMINLLAILTTYIGVIYYHLVVTMPDRAAYYHLPGWLILVTLAVPYIYMWFIGLLAVYEIYGYQRKVAGIVYRQSWNLLALGLGWLIVMSIAVQYLSTLAVRLNEWSIYSVLAFLYSLLLLLGVGFVLIALGARKLQKIEEV